MSYRWTHPLRGKLSWIWASAWLAVGWGLALPAYGSLVVDGSANRFGAFPVIATALSNLAGDDVFPLGGGGFYIVPSLFDTGSTQVVFDPGAALTLGLSGPTAANVRINGLGAIDPGTLGAPLGPPGSPFAAQAEVAGVTVGTSGSLPISLVGAPVATRVVAAIDYATTITRGPYGFLPPPSTVSGPDITFHANADGFSAEATVQLERFGATGTNADGVTIDQRYYARGVTFNEGSSSYGSPDSGPLTDADDTRFLYDTGTNVTLLTQSLAARLNLDHSNPDFTGEVAGDILNGYTLDSIVFGTGSSFYRVDNAQVFVTPGPLGGAADAIIGSNLFSQTSIVFDGPGDRLLIGTSQTAAVPEPSSLVVFGLGALLGLGYLGRRRR